MRRRPAALLLALALSALPAAAQGVARVSTDDRRRALVLFDLLLDAQRLPEARGFYEQRYALGLDTAAWTLRDARLLSTEGRFAAAADVYERLLAASPDDPGLLLPDGEDLEQAGRPDAARAVYEQARRVSSNPAVPYHLAELEFEAGREAPGRRWAETALREIPRYGDATDRVMRLNLRSRLGYDDSVDRAWGRLVESEPDDAEPLFDWASALLRAGAPEEAAEPLALLRERFPRRDLPRRRLESERLRLAGDAAARRAALLGDLARYPGDAQFLLALAEDDLGAQRWEAAEAEALAVSSAPPFGGPRGDVLFQARARDGWRAGPFWRWTEAPGTRYAAEGAALDARLRPGWRLKAEADRAAYRAAAGRGVVSGGSLSAAREGPAGEAAADLDARAGDAPTAVSPGLSAAWHPPGGAWDADAAASWGRLWTASPESVAAGARADGLSAGGTWRPAPRLALGLQATYNHVSAARGGHAREATESPNLMLTLLQTPLYASVGYRFFAEDTSGDDAFFAALPLTRRARTHYLEANAGRSWLAGRLSADGYVFDGDDPGRGLHFGSQLFGFGASLSWTAGRLGLSASFDQSLEDIGGSGERSRSARLAATWRLGAGPRPAPEGVR